MNLVIFPSNFVGQLLPILLSFSDDAVLFVATRFGLHIPGMDWLSPLLLSCSVLWWMVKLIDVVAMRSRLSVIPPSN